MQVLIVGNSQASMLKQAHSSGLVATGSRLSLNFFVIPGGHGPYLTVRDDRMVVFGSNPDYPPYADPEDTPDRPLSGFDAVVVSALGYVDGGFAFNNPITTLATMPEFAPSPEATARELVSAACYRALVHSRLASHYGVRFLRELCDAFRGPVLVQPFPYASAALAEREDWRLRKDYDDYLGAHQIFATAKDAALASICDEAGARLLDYPDPEWRERAMTPAHLMRPGDCIHPTQEHGAMVLRQIVEALA